jgi:SAM-dependent methyltransferase
VTEHINDQTIKTYDAIASDYLARWHDRSPLEAQFKRFVSMLNVYSLNQLPILDVGCGPGFDTAQFRSHSLDVIGVDLSWQMLVIGHVFSPSGSRQH